MKRRFAALAAATLFSVTTAGAQQITFDPFPSIPAGVTLSYFNNVTGPLNALPTQLSLALNATGSAIPGGGSALLTTGLGVLFSFTSPVQSFSLVGNDFGGDPTRDNEIIYLSAFNSLGIFLGSTTTQAVYAQPNLNPASIANPSMSYVAFSFSNDLGYYSIDNVDYTASSTIPEPSTYVLLAAGLAAVAFTTRRRRLS